MSYMASGTLGVVAGALALGAVHLEVSAGNDLLGPAQRANAATVSPARADDGGTIAIDVDRSAKGDRELAVSPTGGVTISFKVPGVSDGSVMVRLPSGDAANALRKSPSTIGTGKGSSAGPRPVACEPVVSVLTAVAKQLAPGRCVT